MASSFLVRLNLAVQRLEAVLLSILSPKLPPGGLCLSVVQVDPKPSAPPPSFSLRDLVGDGFLFAVPRSRRTIERRHKRRFGHPDYVEKIIRPRTNIRTCTVCGDDHLADILCPTCYKKVMDETKAMQEKIQSELKLEPVEKEVVVLYEGEKDGKPDEFWEGKRIVEMEKPRPQWFSKNLLQQTTQQPATTSDVKPSDLG